MTKEIIGNICKLHSGGTPSTKNPEYWNGNLKWLSSAESSKDFIYDSSVFITEKGVNESSTKLATKNSVIIATAGEGKTRGQVSFLETDAYINQSLISIKSRSKEISNLYIYYYLKNNYKRLRSLSDATGIRGSLSGELLKSFEIHFPHVNIQNKITNLLRLIDLKIEINKKINTELESMAKTLYDYWFLQFEFPNKEGKPYKSSGGKMIWSDELKRKIPEGWESKKLSEILEKVNRKYDYSKISKTYDLSIMSSNSISIYGTSSSEYFDTNLFSVKKGDLLFGSIRPYLRKAGIAAYDGAVTGTIHCYEVKNSIDYNLALFSITSENFFKYAINNSKGTKMPVVSSEDLLNYNIPYKEEIVKLFNILSVKDKVVSNVIQSNELASLRDFLLPLLMNGQVTFK